MGFLDANYMLFSQHFQKNCFGVTQSCQSLFEIYEITFLFGDMHVLKQVESFLCFSVGSLRLYRCLTFPLT